MDRWPTGATGAALSAMGWDDRAFAPVAGFRPERAFAPSSGLRPEDAGSPFSGFRPERGQLPTSGITEQVGGVAGNDAWFQQQMQQFGPPPSPTGAGGMPSLGGDWANVDRWNDGIAKAQAQVQRELGILVPASVIKSIMRIESGGNFNTGQGAESPAGARGLMQVTNSTMGNFDYGRLAYDAEYGIYAGVKELALRYQNSPGKNWDQAATGYFSGHYIPYGSSDGYNTDYDYLRMFQQYNSQLTAAGMGSAGIGAGIGGMPGGGNQWAAIWGGSGDYPVSQEFGMTDFARNSAYAQTAYRYTAAYSRTGQVIGHAGVDVSMNPGTSLYAPVGGVVKIAGGSGYYCDVEGRGCGPGVGELLIELPNGDQLILGHMRQINVQAGQVLTAGQLVGLSGSENGGHVHVEYRRWVGPGVTNSGYEAVDPRQALAGGFSGSFAGATGGGMTTPAYSANPYEDWWIRQVYG